MKYILDDIFNNQTRDEYFENNKIVTYMIVDEITNIASTENKSVAQESLVQCVTEGRPNRIGFVYTTQNYSPIDKRIRENTTHLFSFRLKHETRHIKSDFNLSNTQEEDIKSLQKFEMMAMTTDKFIVYDEDGHRRQSEAGEIFRGLALPPVCEPSAPR
jgi:DNA helicase HerA-like ATPase